MTTDPASDAGLANATCAGANATDARLLQIFLAGRDTDCPRCRYNLRDLRGSRCPECGDELVLRIGLAEPRPAAAIAGLIALSAGTGLSGLLFGYYLIRLTLREGLGEPVFLWVNCVGLLVQGAALVVWLMFWRSNSAAQPRRQSITDHRMLAAHPNQPRDLLVAHRLILQSEWAKCSVRWGESRGFVGIEDG